MRLCRKLMGRKVGLADLAEVHPEVHRSLVELLALPGDVVADLALVFQARQAPGFLERIREPGPLNPSLLGVLGFAVADPALVFQARQAPVSGQDLGNLHPKARVAWHARVPFQTWRSCSRHARCLFADRYATNLCVPGMLGPAMLLCALIV